MLVQSPGPHLVRYEEQFVNCGQNEGKEGESGEVTVVTARCGEEEEEAGDMIRMLNPLDTRVGNPSTLGRGACEVQRRRYLYLHSHIHTYTHTHIRT
jgi:hypothetical protein